MKGVAKNIEELVGRTPVLSADRFVQIQGCKAQLLAKLECFNPAGSVKDRVAKAMISAAEEAGVLKPGAAIIEPTSGNTGIGLACIGIPKGYRVILTMPETMSMERRNLLKAYGAELVLTSGKEGMAGAIAKAQELAAQIPGSFLPGQFENSENPKAHYDHTGPELWEQTDGRIDAFVAGVGTGGTITGVGSYLKNRNAEIYVVAVEPTKSPVLSKGRSGPHGLQGMGAGFIPKVLNMQVYDEIFTITEEEAYEAARNFARAEGLLVGISSGAALAAACKLSRREEFRGKTIAVLLPDTGDRYLSTPLFSEESQ